MIKIFQTTFNKEGNCFSACVASILELDIASVPNFQEPEGIWFLNYKEWLKPLGYDLLAVQNADWIEEAKKFRPKVFSIVSGTSPRGFKHSTVYFDLEMVHDPHPGGGGVKDIDDWIYFLPINPKCSVELNKNVIGTTGDRQRDPKGTIR